MIDETTRRRVIALAIGEGCGPMETRRRLARGMDGGAPVEVSAPTIARLARVARERGQADVRPTALASRMLRIVERELASIEAKRGAVDLDRLDKLAATLRRLEPLRSTSGQSEVQPADLRSLVASGDKGTEGDPDGNGSEALP